MSDPDTVEAQLQVEREASTVPTKRISESIYGLERFKLLQQEFKNRAPLPHDFNQMGEGRVEILRMAYEALPIILNGTKKQVSFDDSAFTTYLLLASLNQLPGSAHVGMFMKVLDALGTQHHKKYLAACRTYEVVGCFAQTQIGHGSDVQNLETTAHYVFESGEFEVNSPTLSSAKYWPGDLGFLANYAIVFAQLIVKGKSFGVQPFLIRLRDDQMNCIPNIQVGDIGPKFGYPAKENGYLILNKVRIPKENLVSKYVQFTENGDIVLQGNPKIVYTAMMSIRQIIVTSYPATYSQAITIAARFSLFRKQFRDSNGTEIKLIDYQTQLDKILGRVAQSYAINVMGQQIAALCRQNSLRVAKGDFSLLAEAHILLSLTKPLFSEIVSQGMEICRTACGGHGFSYYSGLPHLIFQYAPNNTHEGENTVMYLQVAKNLLKNYQSWLVKGRISTNMGYLNSADYFKKATFQQETNPWTLKTFVRLFGKTVCNLLSSVATEIASHPSSEQAFNTKAGVKLQQLAILHGYYIIISACERHVIRERSQSTRDLIRHVLTLFAIDSAFSHASYLISFGGLTSANLSLLRSQKQALLKRLRPSLFSLVDAFNIPEHLLRSELVYGNPYENFLKQARKNPVNLGPSEAAKEMRNFKQAFRAKL